MLVRIVFDFLIAVSDCGLVGVAAVPAVIKVFVEVHVGGTILKEINFLKNCVKLMSNLTSVCSHQVPFGKRLQEM